MQAGAIRGWLIGWLAVAVLLAAPATLADAVESRVALVIGNGAYRHAGGLRNPINDAEAMAAALGRFGFEVVKATNADRSQMVRALSEFAKKLRPDGVGLLFYAGHGIQVGGNNYLIPVDADIQEEYDTSFLGINVNDVLRAMENAGSRFNMMFLDACRDNPFERRFRSAGARGLAPIEAPRGALVAYATAPGKTAADGDGVNGLFTAELLKAMARPNLAIEEMLKEAGAGVERASANKQVPWVNSSYRGKFYLEHPTVATANVVNAPARAPAAVATPEAQELAAWSAVATSSNPVIMRAFLKEFPDGRFAGLARAKLEEAPEAVSRHAAPAAAAVEPRSARLVAAQAVRVRADPTSRSLALGAIPSGALVEVTGKVADRDWLRISYEGRVGYVAASLLREATNGNAPTTKSEPAAGPAKVDRAALRAAPKPVETRTLAALPSPGAGQDGGWMTNQQALPILTIRSKTGRYLGYLTAGDSVAQLVLEHPPYADRYGGAGRVVQWSQIFRRDGEVLVRGVRKVSNQRYPLVSLMLQRGADATISGTIAWSADLAQDMAVEIVEGAGK